MNYLLNTCLLSELRKPEPDAGVVACVLARVHHSSANGIPLGAGQKRTFLNTVYGCGPFVFGAPILMS